LLVTGNNRLKFEIRIVHDLSCHPIFSHFASLCTQLTVDCYDTLCNLILVLFESVTTRDRSVNRLLSAEVVGVVCDL